MLRSEFYRKISKMRELLQITNLQTNCNTDNYIIKYLIFCMESVFCNKINGIQFYRYGNTNFKKILS